MHGFPKTIRYASVSFFLMAMIAVPAFAEEGESKAAAPATALTETNPAKLVDPVSSLDGMPDVWSVSRTDAGCYLLSPRRKDSSSLAIGRHPKLGLGLFVVNFGLSVPKANPGEPVAIQGAGGDINKIGRLVGVRLLFMPLDTADIDRGLQGLKDKGTLWLMVRHSWISHAGKGVSEAVTKYSQDCAAAGAAGG